MITPTMSPPSGASSEPACDNMVMVSADALSVDNQTPGDDSQGQPSQSVTPGVGDSVEITGTGKVSAITDGVATITIDSINGMPVEGSATDSTSAPDDGSDVRAMAQKYDDSNQDI